MMLQIIDSILLFALSIPIVMQYRILPVDGTPYWLFGILFFILGFHCAVSCFPDILGRFEKHVGRLKMGLLIMTICITLGGSTVTAMFDRAKTAPSYNVHDIILQQEAAMRYLIVGKNPYKETYFGTPVESFHYAELGKDAVNPALYHFVMPPWYLLFPFLFYYPSTHIIGFFDGRMALLFTMGMLLVYLWYWFNNKAIARIAITLSALSPSVVNYFVEGRSDVFALAWLMGALVFLGRKKFVISSILLALSFLSKQTTWFILPFYIVYLWKQTIKSRQTFWISAFVCIVVGILFVSPFLIWDAKAFIDSVVLYLTGNASSSYPVSGYGLSMVLYDAGIIRDIHSFYPFIYWQIGLALPLLAVLLRWLWKKPSEAKLMMSYAMFLCVYWYLSRYFNNSHLGYLSMLFVLGGLKVIDEAHI